MITLKMEVKFNRFPEITDQMRTRASAAVRATCFAGEGIAKVIVEQKDIWDTGALHGSIHVPDSDNPLEGEFVCGVDYAVYHEYGTYKMAARPFMTPAAEAVFPFFTAEMMAIFG